MQDPPPESVSTFQLRVAGNALDIARRQLELSPATDAAELARLTALLEHGGTLANLNRELAQAIAQLQAIERLRRQGRH